MQFDKGIWPAAWDVYRVNIKSVAIAILAATVLDLFADYMERPSGFGMVADVLIWSMVAISAHGTVLLGSKDLAFTDKKKILVPFVWRSFVLLLLVTLPFLIAFFLLHDEGSFFLSVLKALPVAGLAALVIFALLGTWLPAVVADGNRRIGAAINRAQRSFFYSAPRLLVGPGLVQTVSIATFTLLGIQGALAGKIFSAVGISIADLISLPVLYAVRAFSVTLLAVILSRAYLIAEQTTKTTATQTS